MTTRPTAERNPDATPRLPSWRPGPARDALEAFLDAAPSLAPAERFACFDNDGTLWCERPHYVQELFFFDALRRRVELDPSLAERVELAAVLSGDADEVAAIGLERVALALAGLFEGLSPTAFAQEVVAYLARAQHEDLGRAVRHTVYQPMLELIAELRRHEFTVAIVTGGGTEFVRAVSQDLYGVPPELVVGTLIDYEVHRDARDRPALRRTARLLGRANEGEAKVANIQTQLGRCPSLAAGNSGGDSDMLAWAASGSAPSLALLVDHDDPDREYAYLSAAATFEESTPVTEVARASGWTVVSMASDWDTVFPPASSEGPVG